ncbi:MAG: response regulator [Chloroflexi bacterium]|nr:MAG: response regulator [Chloroflexota bacterium]TME53586.1 MAG: response regulator [Chloroflexota bacterium]
MSGVPAPLPNSDFPPVVIADDDRDVRTMLRTLLELDGHDVMEAKDGVEAWQLCVECQPSVVVADIQMPRLDGLQLCRRIRESRYSPDIKVIVYTAGMATPEEAKNAGCDEYFLKTDPLPKLRDKVRQYTGARNA